MAQANLPSDPAAVKAHPVRALLVRHPEIGNLEDKKELRGQVSDYVANIPN